MARDVIPRGKDSDISARAAHEARVNPPPPSPYRAVTYAMRMDVSPAVTEGMPYFNLGNRWYLSHGRRGGPRRRHEPYWGE